MVISWDFMDIYYPLVMTNIAIVNMVTFKAKAHYFDCTIWNSYVELAGGRWLGNSKWLRGRLPIEYMEYFLGIWIPLACSLDRSLNSPLGYATRFEKDLLRLIAVTLW